MFISEIQAISPQNTYTNKGIYPIVVHNGNRYFAIEPNYSGIIPPNQLRRMGKSLRMGIGAAMPIVTKHSDIQGIILGSADGGLEDCIKFLNQIVLYNEGTLSPTGFVQSTPNAVAGNIASMTKNSGHNCTHVHGGHAFENALLDAFLLAETQQVEKILVGNIDEISDFNYSIEMQGNWFKSEETNNTTLLESNTPGTVCGESACMFLLQSHALHYYAQICDIDIFSFPESNEVEQRFHAFLQKNAITTQSISRVYLGYNGDSRYDFQYKKIETLCSYASNIHTFKNLVGEHPTSIAFAVYLASLELHNLPSTNIPCYTLIYNQYKNKQHTFILLQGKNSA